MGLLGAFIYKRIKCSVQGEVPAHRMAYPAATFNHSPRRVAITQVLLKTKFETLSYSSLLAHKMLSNKGNLQSSLNACWQAGQITLIIKIITTFVLWGPALVGNSIFNTNCAPGEFVITLEGLCKSRIQGNNQGGGPRPESTTRLSILSIFLRHKAIFPVRNRTFEYYARRGIARYIYQAIGEIMFITRGAYY